MEHRKIPRDSNELMKPHCSSCGCTDKLMYYFNEELKHVCEKCLIEIGKHEILMNPSKYSNRKRLNG